MTTAYYCEMKFKYKYMYDMNSICYPLYKNNKHEISKLEYTHTKSWSLQLIL